MTDLAPLPRSVELGGDGDEVAAIEDVEKEFGVTLDVRDAGDWCTAGDVFASLCNALDPAEAARPETWERFRTALASQTGVDPADIVPESPLLAPPFRWTNIADLSALFWLCLIVSAAAAVGWAILR